MYLKYILKLVLVLKKKFCIWKYWESTGMLKCDSYICFCSYLYTHTSKRWYLNKYALDVSKYNKKNTALNCSEKIFPYNVCHDSKKTCTFILNIFNLKIVLFFHKIDSTLSKTEKWTNKCFSNMLINDF